MLKKTLLAPYLSLYKTFQTICDKMAKPRQRLSVAYSGGTTFMDTSHIIIVRQEYC